MADRPLFDETLRSELRSSVLCWLATVDAAGVPNVSPKELFAALEDDRIAIADVASPGSVRNIRVNPAVCVSFVDVFRQRGFKVNGTATVLAPADPDFAVAGAELLRMAGDDFPVRHVIVVRVERVARILAPSYLLFPERSEEERMRAAFATYGVLPAPREER